ncbi:DUF1499 domain-containing protein [Chamaesiphon minutus]|nr:DUF1499 domain-containing protein [Chamaesiphon minutus]
MLLPNYPSFIHTVRSASLLGESDLSINRQRIEEIRTLLAAA